MVARDTSKFSTWRRVSWDWILSDSSTLVYHINSDSHGRLTSQSKKCELFVFSFFHLRFFFSSSVEFFYVRGRPHTTHFVPVSFICFVIVPENLGSQRIWSQCYKEVYLWYFYFLHKYTSTQPGLVRYVSSHRERRQIILFSPSFY